MRRLHHHTPLLTLAVITLAACSDDTATAPVPDAAYAPADAVTLCHRNDWTADFELLMVTPNGRAVEKHLEHGDAMPGDPIPGGFTPFASDCTLPVLALAYTDRDPNDGDEYAPGVDRLISALLDADGSGTPSPGDEGYVFGFPIDFEASAFGSVESPSILVARVNYGSCGAITVTPGDRSTFQWWTHTAFPRFVREEFRVSRIAVLPPLILVDERVLSSGDKIWARPGRPIVPDRSLDLFRDEGSEGDEGFVDVSVTWCN